MTARSRVTATNGEAAGVSALAREIQSALITEIGLSTLVGEFTPTLDVWETEEAVEVVVDIPGVAPAHVRVVARDGVLLVAGVKVPARRGRDTTFHLVERAHGRFARSIAVSRPVAYHRATARLTDGQLLVTLPRLVERRGTTITIPVTAVDTTADTPAATPA